MQCGKDGGEEDGRNGVSSTPKTSPRDSVVDNMHERKEGLQKDCAGRPTLEPAKGPSSEQNRMADFDFSRKGTTRNSDPLEAVSPSRTLGNKEGIPNPSNLRVREYDHSDRRRDSLMHTGSTDMDARGHKRLPSSGREDSSTRTPQCFRCWGAGQDCSGSERCDACHAAGTRMCVYKHCRDGLACRAPRCPYVHPRQIQDESHWTIGPGSLGERGMALKPKSRDPRPSPRQEPICVRCWRRGRWCTHGKQCEPCREDQVRCVYKSCRHGMACGSDRCIAMHAEQYDPEDPAWNVEPGNIGLKNSELDDVRPSPNGRGPNRDSFNRKAICKHCWETSARCDFGDKCETCHRENVACVRVWCDRGKECVNARCPAAHPGQLGEKAVIERGPLPCSPQKTRLWSDVYRG